MESNRPGKYKSRNEKKKIWVDWSHIKTRGWGNTKAALLWNPQGSRKIGRPRNSWRRMVTKEVGRSWNELRFLAADRQMWKDLIDNLCS